MQKIKVTFYCLKPKCIYKQSENACMSQDDYGEQVICPELAIFRKPEKNKH